MQLRRPKASLARSRGVFRQGWRNDNSLRRSPLYLINDIYIYIHGTIYIYSVHIYSAQLRMLLSLWQGAWQFGDSWA